MIVCTASNTAYAEALPLLRSNGTLVCVGMPENQPKAIASAFPFSIISKQLTITGSVVGNRLDTIEALDFAARGIVKVHFRLEKMDSLTSVFKEMDEGKLEGRVVLDLSCRNDLKL